MGAVGTQLVATSLRHPGHAGLCPGRRTGALWAARYSRAVQLTPAEKRPPPLGQCTGPWRWHCWRASSVPEQRTPLISTSEASGLPAQYQVSWAGGSTVFRPALGSPALPPGPVTVSPHAPSQLLSHPSTPKLRSSLRRDPTHLQGMAGEAQPQLPADDHGLIEPPLGTAHRTPPQLALHRHQHLHDALLGAAPPGQAHLWAKRG